MAYMESLLEARSIACWSTPFSGEKQCGEARIAKGRDP